MKVFLAGHRGMVGGAILRQLETRDVAVITRTHSELDLSNQAAVRDFMQSERPDQVILAAAKVGGIQANNTYPADFIYENLMIECNVIHQAFAAGVEKLLQLGSSCIYPKFAEQPMREDALLTVVNASICYNRSAPTVQNVRQSAYQAASLLSKEELLLILQKGEGAPSIVDTEVRIPGKGSTSSYLL